MSYLTMSVSPEIRAMQLAYAAKPYMATVSTGYFSGSFRFDTYAEAVAYLASQVRRNGILPVRSADNWSNEGVRPYDTYVTMPDGSTRDLEAIGLAGRPQGPLANWIIFED
jgi:hypothetical protein